MKLSAEFISSVSIVGAYPRWDRKEIALAGRSNVGKSSLLNALVERRGLARTSKTPGRTRAVNFFGLGANLALVDLPGYGYAKIAHSEAAEIGILVKDYLSRRELLRALVLLIDARRGPEDEEIALLGIRAERPIHHGTPVAMIVAATKCDKLRRSERDGAVKRFAEFGIEPIMCSAVTSEGIEMLRRRIMNVAVDQP